MLVDVVMQKLYVGLIAEIKTNSLEWVQEVDEAESLFAMRKSHFTR